ncbi:hypothetical protein K474DRAFT_1581030, partial [Panus rudis PR-1116 ss-1]
LTRTAKSGAEWYTSDLLSYNIHIENQDFQTFFGLAFPPPPHTRYNAVAQRGVRHTLLRMPVMELAMDPNELTAPIDFTVLLFETVRHHTIALGRRVTRRSRLLLCAARKGHAQTDVCIVDDFSTFPLVRQHTKYRGEVDPAPQLIAEAIKAFDSNNNNRVQA